MYNFGHINDLEMLSGANISSHKIQHCRIAAPKNLFYDSYKIYNRTLTFTHICTKGTSLCSSPVPTETKFEICQLKSLIRPDYANFWKICRIVDFQISTILHWTLPCLTIVFWNSGIKRYDAKLKYEKWTLHNFQEQANTYVGNLVDHFHLVQRNPLCTDRSAHPQHSSYNGIAPLWD